MGVREIESFCPYRATVLHTKLPRAMPWAVSFCPFRACGANLQISSNPSGSNLRPERAKAPSPGQHPGDKQQANLRPERAKALKTAGKGFF